MWRLRIRSKLSFCYREIGDMGSYEQVRVGIEDAYEEIIGNYASAPEVGVGEDILDGVHILG